MYSLPSPIRQEEQGVVKDGNGNIWSTGTSLIFEDVDSSNSSVIITDGNSKNLPVVGIQYDEDEESQIQENRISNDEDEESQIQENGKRKWVIAGSVVGGLAAITLVTIGVCCCTKKRKEQNAVAMIR